MSEPSVTEDAELRANLISDIEAIQAQLGDPNRVDSETGERLPYADYQDWRKRAMTVLRIKKDELRRLKAKMHDAANETTWALLARCYRHIESSLEYLDACPQAESERQSQAIDRLREGAGAVLDAIEDVVPRKFLRNEETR